MNLLQRAWWYVTLSRRRQNEGELGLIRQLAEMAILLVLRGIGPGYYQLAGFWRSKIPWRDKWRHLNGREFHREIRRVNPEPYHKLSQNKLAEKALLTLLHIPSPRFLGYFSVASGVSSDGASLRSADDLTALFRASKLTKFCCKPLEGWAGHGFRAFVVNDDASGCTFQPFGKDERISTRELAQTLQGNGTGEYLLEEVVEQHPQMKAFNPTSVNTLRLWVLLSPKAGTKVVLGYLRIGRQGSLVDNQSAGGIVAPLDLATGSLGRAIDGNPERAEYSAHPDHGAIIEGETVPLLSEALSVATAAVERFPGLRFAGLDVAIGVRQPLILEMNVEPDRQGAAFVDIPTATIFSDA